MNAFNKKVEELKSYVNAIIKQINYEDYTNIMYTIDELKESVTLPDLLGWEEDVEYEYEGDGYKFRMKSDSLTYSNEMMIIGGEFECAYDIQNINWLRQAKKVEPKPKAYHAKDEYSHKCLMRELEEQGYVWKHGGKPTKLEVWGNAKYRDVIYCKEDKTITYGNLLYHGQYEKENYDLIEYHKEEPKFYAKIKGWELTKGSDCYWHKDENPIAAIYPWSKYKASIYTKKEWNELGINDTNADWEEVEE